MPQNPKSEARNPKQFRNSNDRMTQPPESDVGLVLFLSFVLWSFVLVSDLPAGRQVSIWRPLKNPRMKKRSNDER